MTLILYGPYLRKDGRKHVILYDTETRTRRTISYPKWLLEGKLGRNLNEGETTDHVDEDFTNDDPNNLQSLTVGDNIRKNLNARGIKEQIYKGICSICGNEFEKKLRNVKSNYKKTSAGPFCSRHCAGKYNANKQHNKAV